VTYVRCHDDIGWAITPEDAARVGEDDHLHRRFLADFYAGEFPGTFARGARFQPDPRSGEARTSGSAASLAGLESAPDEAAVELAIRRILLLYAVAFAHGGLPLIYMGDEIGQLNDPAGREDADNRWMHRPFMDWDAAERRQDPGSVQGRLWAGLRRLVAARRANPAIHVQGASEPIWTGNEHVFGLVREQSGARLLVLANFTADPQPVSRAGLTGFALTDAAADVDGRPLERYQDFVVLAPYQHLWLPGSSQDRSAPWEA
jgi:amylosucrase